MRGRGESAWGKGIGVFPKGKSGLSEGGRGGIERDKPGPKRLCRETGKKGGPPSRKKKKRESLQPKGGRVATKGLSLQGGRFRRKGALGGKPALQRMAPHLGEATEKSGRKTGLLKRVRSPEENGKASTALRARESLREETKRSAAFSRGGTTSRRGGQLVGKPNRGSK